VTKGRKRRGREVRGKRREGKGKGGVGCGICAARRPACARGPALTKDGPV